MPWHSAYHGLVRAVVTVTEDSASPLWHRQRLQEVDMDHGAITRIVTEDDDEATSTTTSHSSQSTHTAHGMHGEDSVPIVIRASAPGLPDATIAIPTSNDASTASVLAVARASAGKAVVLD